MREEGIRIQAAAEQAGVEDVPCPQNQTLCHQYGWCLISPGWFPIPLPIIQSWGATAKPASPVTPGAGDAGARGSDHKNGESSNLRLQISFILQPGRQKPPVVQHLAADHTGSLGKARERSQVSAG